MRINFETDSTKFEENIVALFGSFKKEKEEKVFVVLNCHTFYMAEIKDEYILLCTVKVLAQN